MSNSFEQKNDHKGDPNDAYKNDAYKHDPHEHSGMFFGLIAGLVIALAGCGYLAVRVNQMNDQMTQMQGNTKTQISSLSAATTSLLEERMQGLNQQLTDIKGAADSTSAAVKQTRALAQRQSTELTNKLEDQQKQLADQLAQLKDATTTADTKISEVSSDVSNVKTDVNGVRTDVNGVRTDVNSVKSDVISTQAGLEKTIADLKRAMGDMGVMSGLIATNSTDLAALRELGERNYTEFDLSKKEGQKKIGNVTIAFKKSDPGRNRYTVEVLADDKRVEKKDRTINEPVQLYVNGNRQPYEIVVNQVKRDEIVGYLSTPKVTLARQ